MEPENLESLNPVEATEDYFGAYDSVLLSTWENEGNKNVTD